MAKRFEFLFDVQCPFAYLASTQVEALAAATGAEIVYKPVLLGGIYNALDDGGPYKRPMPAPRAQVAARDAQRWANYWSVPLAYPPGHPVRSVLAMRAIVASGDIPRAAHALFKAAWGEGKSILDPAVLESALTRAGFDDAAAILERAETQPVKDELRARTDEAVQRGAFGVPTFFVDGEMFWGQDRLDFVARALGAEGYSPLPPTTSNPNATEVEAWFDYSSPFAYLGMTQIERIAHAVGAKVVFKPFLLGGLFREIGTPDVPLLAASEPKRLYMGRELQRWADRWGVPFRFTTRFPMRTLLPLRATYALMRETPEQVSPFVQAVYRALWVEDRDISQPDVLEAVARESHVDPQCVEKANAPENKQALIEAGQQAREAGLCGALFWGQDRLQLVEAALTGWRPPQG